MTIRKLKECVTFQRIPIIFFPGEVTFSPLDVIKVLSRLEKIIIFFIFNNFSFSIPTAITTDSLANKHQK